MKRFLISLLALMVPHLAAAQVINTLPYSLQNGTTADASQVMANFNQIVANANSNAAHNGSNSDLTSISSLASGSAAVPTLRFSAATSTGVYYDGANLGLSVGGVERAYIPSNIGAASAVLIPGEVRMFAMGTCPAGWLETAGSAISRTTYAGLFTNIGTTWGAGDGSTTFNVPDFRGTFLRAWDHARGLDPAAPTFAQYEADTYQIHNHGVSEGGGHQHGLTPNAWANSGGAGFASGPGWAQSTLGATNFATTGITINSNGSPETRPKAYNVLYCIKL